VGNIGVRLGDYGGPGAALGRMGVVVGRNLVVIQDGVPIGGCEEWKLEYHGSRVYCRVGMSFTVETVRMKSLLQRKSEEAACRVFGIQPFDVDNYDRVLVEGLDGGDSAARAPLDGFDWAAFLEFAKAIAETIMSLMGNCPANKSAMVRAIRSPNWLQRVRFSASLRSRCDCCKAGDARSKYVEGAEAALSVGSTLTIAEATALIDELTMPGVDNSI
jgi:hypothetical protein